MKQQGRSPQHIERVRAIWRQVRQARGMSNVEFARELSERLGFNIGESSVSRWIEGTGPDRLGEVPSADKFLAVLEMGGYDVSPSGPTGGDQALREQQEELERQMRDLNAAVMALASGDPEEARKVRERLALPRALGPGFHTVAEAAERKGVSRQTIYAWIEQGRLTEYRGPGGRMVRIDDLDALEQRRPGPAPAPAPRVTDPSAVG